MVRILATTCVIALLATTAFADRLELLDGRSFVGVVTVAGDTVTVEMTYGTLQFTKKDVRRIVFKETPEEELAKRLAAVAPGDTEALMALAVWAQDHNKSLKRQAKEILTQIIALDGEHAEARRRLGYVKIDSKWRTLAGAMELATGKLEAGRFDSLLTKVLPAMDKLPMSPADRVALRELLAKTQLRAGRFAQATRTFAALADSVTAAQAFRYAAIAGILGSSPDGMYVLTEPYPPSAALLGGNGDFLKPGPASLALPLTLKAALRDCAKKEIQAGRKLLDEARKAGPAKANINIARTKLALAERRFQQADALVPEIARSYYIEITRRRIVSHRKLIEADARKYEQVNADLAKRRISAKEYRTIVLRMIHHLDSVKDGLKDILAVAKPYPRELVLEIKWAELDLERIAKMRKVLAAELDSDR